jgi:hypothetical protein
VSVRWTPSADVTTIVASPAFFLPFFCFVCVFSLGSGCAAAAVASEPPPCFALFFGGALEHSLAKRECGSVERDAETAAAEAAIAAAPPPTQSVRPGRTALFDRLRCARNISQNTSATMRHSTSAPPRLALTARKSGRAAPVAAARGALAASTASAASSARITAPSASKNAPRRSSRVVRIGGLGCASPRLVERPPAGASAPPLRRTTPPALAATSARFRSCRATARSVAVPGS